MKKKELLYYCRDIIRQQGDKVSNKVGVCEKEQVQEKKARKASICEEYEQHFQS